MDMKKILQALDGASTKPVEGANDMSKFLRIITEGAEQVPPMPDITGLQAGQPKDLGSGEKVTLNADGTVRYEGGWGTYIYNAQGQHIKTQSPTFAGYSQATDAGGNVTQQNYQQGPLSIQKGPQGTQATAQVGGQEFQTSLNEGANPHKVSLPVQMAMQHYQQEDNKPIVIGRQESLLKKYIAEAEAAAEERAEEKRNHFRQYAKVIAERVMMKESAVTEAPIVHKNDIVKTDLQPGEEVACDAGMGKTIFGVVKRIGRTMIHVQTKSGNIAAFAPKYVTRMTPTYWQDKAEANKPKWMKKKGHNEEPSSMWESVNQPDSITLDVPLLIRLLEYAREDAKTDIDLHNVAEQLVSLSRTGDVLSMDNYDVIVGSQLDEAGIIKPKKKTSTCRSGQVQTGMQTKDGKLVPKCSVK